MARFPHYKSNAKALGKLIAAAATDPALQDSFRKDPKSFLEKIGLPKQTTELMRFSVVCEADTHQKAVALPYRLNADKLERKDADYLGELSNLFPQTALN